LNLIAYIAQRSVFLFGLILLVIQLLAYEAGNRAGRSRKAEGEAEGVGAIVGSMLAVSAFVLALTLSFASSRFTERRAGTLAETNAIGTAWLRARVVGGPHGTQVARLLEQYTQVRLDFVLASRNSPAIERDNQQTSALQSEISQHTTVIVHEEPNPVSASLMAAVNDLFDMTTAERFVYELRLPPQIFRLLILMILLGMSGLGYQLGLKARPLRTLVVLLCVVWTTVVVDILDLGSARLGTFRTEIAAYEWTLQGFKKRSAGTIGERHQMKAGLPTWPGSPGSSQA
jgi:hypothetical protein